MSRLHIVILAAGQGTRMRSAMPKVLHPIAGRPMLSHVVGTARELEPEGIHVVFGHGGERVQEVLSELPVTWVEQAEQLGTGHAVEQAMSGIPDDAGVLVLYGDVPLITPGTLGQCANAASRGALALVTVYLADPTGYGRILRDEDDRVTGIVEQKDASNDQLSIQEGNTGILCAPAGTLRAWLSRLDRDNAQGEFYLTDVVAMAAADGVAVEAVHPSSEEEVLGVNDRVQLAFLERAFQRQQAEQLMREGVSLADPQRVDVRGSVRAGRDVWLDVNVIMEGHVELGDEVRIGPNVVLRDCVIESGAEILANSLVDHARVGRNARVGPFARLRPGADLAEEVHVGNFVEVKNTSLGPGSKANHLTYLGDSRIGSGVNVGAGTITCNYDGANKHRTVIGDGAFIGSGVELVAPVTIEDGATIGAGSTISRDAPAGQLTLTRAKQTSIRGWQRPRKKPRDS